MSYILDDKDCTIAKNSRRNQEPVVAASIFRDDFFSVDFSKLKAMGGFL
jgi:hypothetical protein